jgi:hypothetical protein
VEENCDDSGINDPEPALKVEIFPVPAHNELNLSVSAEEEITGILIHDHLGREVLTLDVYQSKIDVSGCTLGMHTITLTSNSSYIVKKFLIY